MAGVPERAFVRVDGELFINVKTISLYYIDTINAAIHSKMKKPRTHQSLPVRVNLSLPLFAFHSVFGEQLEGEVTSLALLLDILPK